MKKWLFPIACSFVSVIAFLLSGAVGVLANGDSTGYGGIVIVLCGWIVYFVIGMPAMCLFYSKQCLSGQKFRVFLTFYQSVLISLPYLIWFLFLVSAHYPLVLLLWVWCEIWGLIGLVKLKPHNKDNLNRFSLDRQIPPNEITA